MKLLVVLLVVLFGLWLWRRGREADIEERKATAPKPRPPLALPAEMVRCSVCGLHLPASEAVHQGRETFCSPAHQRQAEPR
ncbi:MAG: hypothetical protein JWP29_4218 [Rhodoferax sp.]|nr:hypothetical protein [Rhodoferax sp.]